MADEIAGMFASIDDPQTFFSHDIRFHRAVGVASGNPIVASLAEMVSGLHYEHRRDSAKNALSATFAKPRRRTGGSTTRSAQRDAAEAREAMNEHLLTAQAYPGRRAATGVTDSARAGLKARLHDPWGLPREPSQRGEQVEARLADGVFGDSDCGIGVTSAPLCVDHFDVESSRRPGS